jgi:arylsulfatase A-like enzyme
MAMIARIDQNAGRILRKLDQLELMDDTAVVFVSSSGYSLGEHQLFGSGPAFYDEIIRVPLCVRWPGSGEGRQIEHVVSLVDLCPTLCEVASIAVPFGIQGRSLVPMMSDPVHSDATDERFLEYHRHPAWAPSAALHLAAAAPPGTASTTSPSHAEPPAPPPAVATPEPPPVEARVRGIVTSRYKLIDYLDDQDLLYDLRRDPKQLENVMSDFQYKPVQQVLYDRLRQWRQQTRDPFPPQ